ncbi:hypothetical protein D3C76_1031780 [compost metagenome]
MARDDHFWHHRHADHIAAHVLHHVDFRSGFEVWPRVGDEHAFVQRQAEIACRVVQFFAQIFVVGICQAEEAWTKTIVIRPNQRRGRHGVDVIVKRHQAACRDVRIKRTGGVGAEHKFAAEQLKGAYRVGHNAHPDTLVEMPAPLHADEIHAVQ